MPRSIPSTLPSEGSSIASPSIPSTHPPTPPGSPTQSLVTDDDRDDATLVECPRASLLDTETLVNPTPRRHYNRSPPPAVSNSSAPLRRRRIWQTIIHNPSPSTPSVPPASATGLSQPAVGSPGQRSVAVRMFSSNEIRPGGHTPVNNTPSGFTVVTQTRRGRGRRGGRQTNVVVHNPSPVSLDRTSVNSDPEAHDVDA